MIQKLKQYKYSAAGGGVIYPLSSVAGVRRPNSVAGLKVQKSPRRYTAVTMTLPYTECWLSDLPHWPTFLYTVLYPQTKFKQRKSSVYVSALCCRFALCCTSVTYFLKIASTDEALTCQKLVRLSVVAFGFVVTHHSSFLLLCNLIWPAAITTSVLLRRPKRRTAQSKLWKFESYCMQLMQDWCEVKLNPCKDDLLKTCPVCIMYHIWREFVNSN